MNNRIATAKFVKEDGSARIYLLVKIEPCSHLHPISILSCATSSGVFAVTFSVVFAYVADVTDESERSSAYGLVSATFAASLVTSPALGAYLEQMYSEEVSVTAVKSS